LLIEISPFLIIKKKNPSESSLQYYSFSKIRMEEKILISMLSKASSDLGYVNDPSYVNFLQKNGLRV